MSNPFLTKKDPLVRAVMEAQKDGQFRRQAEALVNEHFGVYSRKAVIRENLAAYDAALEEAYKAMKEGHWEGSKKDRDEDAKLAKKHGMTMAQWEKSDADKKHDAKEKHMKEGTPENIMNPNSQWAKNQAADKNNPFNQPTPNPADVAPNIVIRGNTQGGSSSMVDKVKSMFREGNDGNLANNYPPYDKVTRGDVIAGRLGKDQMGGKKMKMKEGLDVVKRDPSVQGSGDVTRSPKGYEDPSTPKVPYSELPKTGNRAGSVIDSAKGALKENGTSIEEERKRTASVADAFMKGQKANQRTLRTDGKSITYHGNTIAKHEGDEVHVTTAGHSHSPSTRGHINGVLSRLGSDKLSVKKGQLHHGKNPVDHDSWIKVKKPQKATFGEENIDEAAYSAKAASAGKDIGKPGKNFAKIAAKAGEKYGSAEKGKKVAGAILSKIRAKHAMKEDSSF